LVHDHRVPVLGTGGGDNHVDNLVFKVPSEGRTEASTFEGRPCASGGFTFVLETGCEFRETIGEGSFGGGKLGLEDGAVGQEQIRDLDGMGGIQEGISPALGIVFEVVVVDRIFETSDAIKSGSGVTAFDTEITKGFSERKVVVAIHGEGGVVVGDLQSHILGERKSAVQDPEEEGESSIQSGIGGSGHDAKSQPSELIAFVG